MADFPTFQDLQRIARDEILARSTKITRDAVERDGTDVNVLVAAACAVGDEVVGQLASVEAGLFLASATGKKLDRLCIDRYGLTRKPASPSVGSVELSTTASNPSAFTVPVGTRFADARGKVFISTASAIFPASSTGPVSVAVRSAAAGLSQQAAAGTIKSILDAPPGSPTDLACTNSLATAGGDDEEQDDALRERATMFFTTARRGTIKAIEAAALAVPGVRKASLFEVVDGAGRPAGAAELVVSDAFTDVLVAAGQNPASYQAQSQVLAELVYQGLSDARAGGVYINVIVAQVVLQSVVLALSFQAGVDADAVALKARAAVVAYTNSLRPGAWWVPADAVAALRSVAGLIVTGSEILSPTGTVKPASLQAIRATLGLVAATTLQPDRALQGSANPDGS